MKPKKARNKRHVPRTTINAVEWAVAGVHKLPACSVAATMEPVDAAVLLLKKGKATRDDWNIVCQALNLAEAMAVQSVGANLMAEIIAGQRWLHQIALRMIERGTSTCYAAELDAIDEAVTMYRAQMQVCTQAEFGRAVRHVKNLHRSGAMDDVGRMYVEMAGTDRAGVLRA